MGRPPVGQVNPRRGLGHPASPRDRRCSSARQDRRRCSDWADTRRWVISGTRYATGRNGRSSSTSHAARRQGRHRRGTGVRPIGSSGSPHEKQSSTPGWMSGRARRLSTGAGHGGICGYNTAARQRTSWSSSVLTWDLLATSFVRSSAESAPLGRMARSAPTSRIWTPAAATSSSRASAVRAAPRPPRNSRSALLTLPYPAPWQP